MTKQILTILLVTTIYSQYQLSIASIDLILEARKAIQFFGPYTKCSILQNIYFNHYAIL